MTNSNAIASDDPQVYLADLLDGPLIDQLENYFGSSGITWIESNLTSKRGKPHLRVDRSGWPAHLARVICVGITSLTAAGSPRWRLAGYQASPYTSRLFSSADTR